MLEMTGIGLKVKKVVKKHSKSSSGQTRHVQKGDRVRRLVEFCPRQITWMHYCWTKKDVAHPKTIMELKVIVLGATAAGGAVHCHPNLKSIVAK